MAYIYQITNDINQKIYIGKTENSIEKRFKEHCWDASRERNEKRPLYNAMRKYGVEHFHIELIEETNNPEEREVYWIEKKQSFKNGYNATIGGDGRKYIDYDLVVKTYQDLQNIKLVAKQLNHDESTISKILKEKNIDIKSSIEWMRENRGKKVGQYDLNDNFIQSFDSRGLASKYLIDNHYTTSVAIDAVAGRIGQVCNGKRKTAYGFKWKSL